MSKVDEMFVWPRSIRGIRKKYSCFSRKLGCKMTNNTNNWFASTVDRASYSMFVLL